MKRASIFAIACVLCSTIAVLPAHAGNVVVGVNIWNEGSLSAADQDAEIRQMAESGVKTIRTSMFPNTIDFIIKASRQGIGSVVIVYPFLGSTAKSKGGWAQVPLSEVNPQEFTAAFKPLLDQLDAAGVRLAAIELGNEFNLSGFNGDISSPGSARVLGARDLDDPADAEARVIAAGFRSYLKVMAALKDLRDHSKLNQGTPLILAGLAVVGPPAPKASGWNKGLAVSLLDTIEFLRQNGLDQMADGYGVHVYPDGDPRRPVAMRIASFEQTLFTACTSSKPCWLTEWGFGNADQSCPLNDETRMRLIQDMRSVFKHFVDQRRLGAIIYYDWLGTPGTKQFFAVFRCGALTAAGKLALSPM